MADNIVPLLSFVLISTFTPGPNNISSASMGVLHGYKNTLMYQVGMAAGVFCVMLLSGWLSTSLLNFFPTFESILRIIGAGYILYLAFGMLKASYTFNENDSKPIGFAQGFMLQLLNPKLIVYGLTLFTAFLAPITSNTALLVLAVILLTATAFCATSSWALFGTTIKTYLHQPQVKAIVNIILALFLVYTAIELAGII
ncbi:MAG: LysE family translocator [Chloroflexi bacterium]|nr:LysE family translocator [Chloroflexota bacterium]